MFAISFLFLGSFLAMALSYFFKVLVSLVADFSGLDYDILKIGLFSKFLIVYKRLTFLCL